MNRVTIDIVGTLVLRFVLLLTYALVFKPRNDNFDEGAANVLAN
tara:strand:+ start:324 stop:455 length:132 start_codon:yes stop_codon:yes gene_type:complete